MKKYTIWEEQCRQASRKLGDVVSELPSCSDSTYPEMAARMRAITGKIERAQLELYDFTIDLGRLSAKHE